METGITTLGPELLALIGSGGVTALAPFTREIYLIDSTVAGTSFCSSIENIEPHLTEGVVLKMLRDPANEHDQQAVGIYFDTTRIGWVPQEQNEIISRLMDAGKAFFLQGNLHYS